MEDLELIEELGRAVLKRLLEGGRKTATTTAKPTPAAHKKRKAA